MSPESIDPEEEELTEEGETTAVPIGVFAAGVVETCVKSAQGAEKEGPWFGIHPDEARQGTILFAHLPAKVRIGGRAKHLIVLFDGVFPLRQRGVRTLHVQAAVQDLRDDDRVEGGGQGQDTAHQRQQTLSRKFG
jgi:hypothetical protein